MSKHSHEIVKCSCGNIIGQCRCMMKDKPERIIDNGCAECKGKDFTMPDKLEEKFEEMHKKGPTSWFDAGHEERKMIINSGWPWEGKTVLEIGCGEGHLASIIAAHGANTVTAIDSSKTAIKEAERVRGKIPGVVFVCEDYRKHIVIQQYDTLVLQGLLEHLNHPWTELGWMLDTFKPQNIIVSAPCFINPRGYVWMILATLFKAPMSLTDKHFLHPWDFTKFAAENELHATMGTCELSWGNGPKMMEDLKQRLPKVFQDMETPIKGRLSDLFKFLEGQEEFLSWQDGGIGAVAVYKLTTQPQE